MKKSLSVFMLVLLINLVTLPSVFASESKAEKEIKFAEKVKTQINRLGVSIESKVQVKLKDGTKLKGYVSEITGDSFVITDGDGKSTSVPYNKTKQIQGQNLSKRTIFAIGIGAFIIIMALVIASSAK